MYNDEEIWKDIKGYEGIAQVSTHGNLRTIDRENVNINGVKRILKGKPLAQTLNTRVNKMEIILNKNNTRKTIATHRLVAEAFIENEDPDTKVTVNHKDGDRLNNHHGNLEWASYSENLKHAYDHLNRPVNRAAVPSRKCLAIDLVTEELWQCDSVAHTSRKTGISETQIRRIASGECVNKKFDFYIKGINEDFC